MSEDPYFAAAEEKFYQRTISPKVVRVLKQTGKRPNIPVDKVIRAMKPGKRISKTGHTYWETRKNRSDVIPKDRI